MLLFVQETCASDSGDCILEKYKEYSIARVQWQLDSTSIIKKHKPSLAEVADIYMHDQLLHIERSLLEVKLLLSTAPDKINTNNRINQWIDIDSQKKKELMEISGRYREILILEQKARNRTSHPDGDELRSIMRTKIMHLPEFHKLISNLNEKVDEIESRVCAAT